MTTQSELTTTLEKNISQTQARIDEAVSKAGRESSDVVLVAVSKKQPLEKLQAAYALGLRHFGENQIQEGVEKVEALADDIVWHFIGRLQKNKARKAVKHFHVLHGIDSSGLLQRINVIAGEEGVHPKVFIQVNFANDPAKAGLPAAEVAAVLKEALAMEHLTCIGLMGMPPQAAEAEEIAAYYGGMCELRDGLRDRLDWPGQLSMGMSGDFEIAIAHGASHIRLGSTIFGARTY